jgi:hypothetical protein
VSRSLVLSGRKPCTANPLPICPTEPHALLQAGQFADVLLEIAETTDIVGKRALFGEGRDEIRVKVARKGRGVLIDSVDVQTGNTVKASLTPGMARDLARIIRNEATTAAKHFAEEE